LVFYSSIITMMYGPINISCLYIHLATWTTEKSTFDSEQLQEFADALEAIQPSSEWVPVS